MGQPLSMGPIALPTPKRKRRWGWWLVWTLSVFAGGIAAGPTLITQGSVLIERGFALFGMTPPPFVESHKPAAPAVVATPASAALVEPIPEEKAAQAPQNPPPVAAAPERAKIVAAASPAARSPQKDSSTKSRSHAEASAKTAGRYQDPFTAGAEGAADPVPATPSRKPKPTPSEAAPTTKAEPAAKPAASKSHDPLDNLMADVVTDNSGKPKKRESKDLDAMLKDVQKSNPEPAPKRETSTSLPTLSAADISKAMAPVKTRGKECAQNLGQAGVAELKLSVGKDGRVSDVRLGGKLAGTPVGLCIEKAARAASFPPSAGLRFDYRIDAR
jgi:hypothetical protein